MPDKSIKKQQVKRRLPKQERSHEKIALILEAATRILDKDGMEGLTTNRIADVAGISIGTLYQYFGDKSEIIKALGQREMKKVTDKIIATLAAPANGKPLERARVLVDAIFGAFGGRSRVHRILLEYALLLGHGSTVDASPNLIASLLASHELPRPDGQALRLSAAEAFVLTHACSGVIRASVRPQANALSRDEIKEVLLVLITSFLASCRLR
jgi:AcrR family transcriptional regulator